MLWGEAWMNGPRETYLLFLGLGWYTASYRRETLNHYHSRFQSRSISHMVVPRHRDESKNVALAALGVVSGACERKLLRISS